MEENTNKVVENENKITISLELERVIKPNGCVVYCAVKEEEIEEYYDDLVLNNPKTYTEKLEKASQNGIKKTLFDISRSVDHEEEYRILNSQESGIKCNVFNTIATYYPKSPYGREDYKVDLTIDCSE